MPARIHVMTLLMALALGGCGGGGGGGGTTAPTTPALAAPQNVKVAASNASVTLAWDAVSGAGQYNLCYASEPVLDPANCQSYSDGVLALDVTSPHTISGLANGTAYHLVVTAVAGAIESSSAERTATPGALNDSGIDGCADGTTNNLDCPVADFAGQDGEHGRDAAVKAGTLYKTGGGAAGFDFSKICHSGQAAGEGNCPVNPTLGDGQNNWGCTYDNHTGLMWEVKVDNAFHLRHKDHTYTWYNSDTTTNGGAVGTANGGTCFDTTNCDTEKFAAAVNQTMLCNHNDWRLPTRHELHSLVHYGASSGATIDADYFPNTVNNLFWSSSPYAGYTYSAWYVNFVSGYVGWDNKNVTFRVRLVRAGQ